MKLILAQLKKSKVLDEYDEQIQCPSLKECQSALEVMKRFVTCNGDSSHHGAINCIDELIDSMYFKCCRQTQITDFFPQ